MAHTKFPVEVVTPEGSVFDGEVEMISTRTEDGVIGLLARHTPLLAMLRPTELRLYKSDDEIVKYAQGEGYLQFQNNRAQILAEEIVPVEELDAEDLQAKLDAALEATKSAEPGSEDERRLERTKRRLESFLEVARGDKSD